MSLSGHAVEIRVKVEIFQLERICRPTNPRERARTCTAKVWRDKSKQIKKICPIHVYTFTLYGILSPRRVWCERTGEVSRQTAKIDIFIQKIAGPFASYKKHVCDTGYRYGSTSSLHVEGHIR